MCVCINLIVVGPQIYDFGNEMWPDVWLKRLLAVCGGGAGSFGWAINVHIDCHLGLLTKRLTFCHALPQTDYPPSNPPPIRKYTGFPAFCCNRKQINKAINFYLYFHTRTCEFPKSANQILSSWPQFAPK